MSTVVVRSNEDKLSALRKFIRSMDAKMRVVKNEEDIMAKLIEEGLQSEDISLESFKKELI